MKEKLLKMAQLNQEVVSLIKEEKFEEVVTKVEEIAELQKEIEADAAAMEEEIAKNATLEERVAKMEEVLKNVNVEEIKKYASLNVSAETLTNLMAELTAAKETIAKQGEDLEAIKKSSRGSQQVGADNGDNVWA